MCGWVGGWVGRWAGGSVDDAAPPVSAVSPGQSTSHSANDGGGGCDRVVGVAVISNNTVVNIDHSVAYTFDQRFCGVPVINSMSWII